ncbi:PepSY-like domain-containing protein [Spirosoma montaniterrae]|uniref:Putative beta-lactamase-inhibitor-like PepSY-like domain-containing protein n=1 Tax=Spirosoma montaniterrae TaxID=1178516 RepID=A0A1P9WUC9_9BACT|nr:PepSY-like domain-containing protein [Spirosoma montaniterrae]AQG78982.1 hypothetical protein AWR27_06355 [Spirosoma montaniterrae]
MKQLIFSSLIALFGLTLWSCNQQEGLTVDAASAVNAARLSADSTGFHCRDSLTRVAVSALPATVTSYITSKYTSAIINYAAKDDAGNFLVAITQADGRKALLFNADGSFNKEVALRGKGGPGRGHGGPGRSNRDSLAKVAVSALPAAITSYITTNYASATINGAVNDPDRGYIVMITQNGQRKSLLFDTTGKFVQEIVRGLGRNYTLIETSALPTNVTAYINTNYAGSTIKVAGKSSTGQFKVIVQASSGGIVELLFAADGAFIQANRRRR